MTDWLFNFLIRYLINLASLVLLVRWIYYPRYRNKDFVFSFSLFNSIIFLVCFLLSSDQMNMGFAFGLFAIFSMLRYRTVTIPIREMGYFFLSIALAILNALMNIENSHIFQLSINAILIAGVYLLEGQKALKHENFKEIHYEKIEWIKPAFRKQMIQDLSDRTGLPIHRVEIISIDFLKDIALVHVFYMARENERKSGESADEED
jgi:hypothetical protein